HAHFYLHRAEAAAAGLQSDQQARLLAWLEREHDNLRAALRWAQETGQAEVGLRLGAALARFWFIRGYYSEGRAALGAVLALPGASDPLLPPQELLQIRACRARALRAAGDLARAQGDYPSAGALCAESLALYRELGDKKEIAIALNRVAIVAHDQTEFATARV